jgi:NAD(P)H-hydrate epimerase
MKIFVKEQIKEIDKYTIENEPVLSISLMERASEAIAGWIAANTDCRVPLLFVTGKGNNGGDGLAVARILNRKGFRCSVCPAYGREFMSEECRINYDRLPPDIPIVDSLSKTGGDTIIVDALLGTGVSGKVKEPVSKLISHINSLSNEVISIDMPSGMTDSPAVSHSGNSDEPVQAVRADITLTLEFPKLAMMLPESGEYAGKIITLPIGLSKSYIEQTATPYHYIDSEMIGKLERKRLKFGHKNTCGHALLICGSKNMTGAAILAAGGALRSGCGLVSVHIPYEERVAVQTVCPSAILSTDKSGFFSEIPDNLDKYTAIGTGCGMGMNPRTVKIFEKLLKSIKVPTVIDADALNIISANKKLLKYIPENSVLTPHIGELKRLTGEWKSEYDKSNRVTKLASRTKSVVIVKGAHTAVYMPDGNVCFNSTGNAGMAKGGCGDVLTGLITGLLARGYNNFEAAIIAVYFHGLAGDAAKDKYGMESMNSSDIVKYISVYNTCKSGKLT